MIVITGIMSILKEIMKNGSIDYKKRHIGSVTDIKNREAEMDTGPVELSGFRRLIRDRHDKE